MTADDPNDLAGLPDDELLRRIREGDSQAEDALFRLYYDRIVSYARRRMNLRLQQAEPASDIAQSAMKSVLLGIPAQQFDVARGETLWPLLVTIVLNKIRDRARKYSGPRRNLAKQDRLENYSLLAAGEGAHSQVELDDLIQHLLAGFPPRRRRIMELLLEGHRTGEIARQVGVSERTVYNTHQQAKDSLAELLSRQGGLSS